jgi:hypothetical protein
MDSSTLVAVAIGVVILTNGLGDLADVRYSSRLFEMSAISINTRIYSLPILSTVQESCGTERGVTALGVVVVVVEVVVGACVGDGVVAGGGNKLLISARHIPAG